MVQAENETLPNLYNEASDVIDILTSLVMWAMFWMTNLTGLPTYLRASFRQNNQPTFGHHVEDVVHDCRSEFEIEVTLDALFGHGFGDAFGVTTFKLTRQQIAQPSLQERRDTAHKEQPDSPTRSPKSAAGAFADRTL